MLLQNSYLWKIHTTPPIYLFGTMHVPYTALWNRIPENVKRAFSSSEELCLELKLLDAGTLSELSQCRLLPSGETLDDVLSEELLARVARYLDRIKDLLPAWVEKNKSGSFLFGSKPSR